MQIDYDGTGAREFRLGIWAMALYEQEFGGDIVKDLFGRAVADDSDDSLIFDFTRVNWTVLSKVLWAGLKAADDSVPSFARWARTVGDVNLLDLNGQVAEAANQAFFRTGAAVSE